MRYQKLITFETCRLRDLRHYTLHQPSRLVLLTALSFSGSIFVSTFVSPSCAVTACFDAKKTKWNEGLNNGTSDQNHCNYIIHSYLCVGIRASL